MIKYIELNRSAVAMFSDRQPFLIPDNLTLKFKGYGYDLSNAVITLENGKTKKQFAFSHTFDVPNEFLFEGNLRIKITASIGEFIRKEWNCLPLRIIETSDETRAFDELAELQKEIKDIKANYVPRKDFDVVLDKLNEVIEKQNTIAETVGAMKENY